MENKKVKFRVYKNYFEGTFEIKEGTIIGETPKFYKIETADGSIAQKKKRSD